MSWSTRPLPSPCKTSERLMRKLDSCAAPRPPWPREAVGLAPETLFSIRPRRSSSAAALRSKLQIPSGVSELCANVRLLIREALGRLTSNAHRFRHFLQFCFPNSHR